MAADGATSDFILLIEPDRPGVGAWWLFNDGAEAGPLVRGRERFSDADAANAWGLLEAHARGARRIVRIDRTKDVPTLDTLVLPDRQVCRHSSSAGPSGTAVPVNANENGSGMSGPARAGRRGRRYRPSRVRRGRSAGCGGRA